MRFLSIDEYNMAERQARESASYPAIRAFSPVAFAQVNFPTRVSAEQELRRYCDIMYELLPRREWLETKLYSAQEVVAIRQLVAQIRTITQRSFGRAAEPLMCLFPPIPIFRAIEAIATAQGRRLNVFEVGPGSGYLGAYVLNAGHRYSAMDNCQALYLWQNRLFASIVDDCAEWAFDRGAAHGIAFELHATHIPWWHFARFHESLPAKADIVVCDAAMGEMDTFALRYVLRIMQAMLVESDCGAFIYQNLGEERVHQRAFVESYLAQLGFQGFQVDGVSIFSNRELREVFPADVQHLQFLGSSDSALFAPMDFLSGGSPDLLESYGFFDFIGLVPDQPRMK
jgi:hypothetical protein